MLKVCEKIVKNSNVDKLLSGYTPLLNCGLDFLSRQTLTGYSTQAWGVIWVSGGMPMVFVRGYSREQIIHLKVTPGRKVS